MPAQGDTVVVYVDKGRGHWEFLRVAQLCQQEFGGHLYAATTGREMLRAIRGHERIARLIVCGHGTTRALLRPGRSGVHVRVDRLPRWVSIDHLANELGPRLVEGARVTLFACLTGRSPHWWLNSLYGRVLAPWTAVSYRDGGRFSFASRLRDALLDHCPTVEVFGATVAGHLSRNPTGRAFGRPKRSKGASIMVEAWGPKAPTQLRWRRAWVKVAQEQGRWDRFCRRARWMFGEDVAWPSRPV